jgi:hypothetical protein
MKYIKNIFFFYINGFKNMKVGKKLWSIIFIKVFIILFVLNFFVYDRSISSEYTSDAQKSEFVSKNLIKD